MVCKRKLLDALSQARIAHQHSPRWQSCAPNWRGHVSWASPLGPRIFVRGAKRTTTVALKDLPQGALPPVPVEPIEESDGPAYPTVVQQARDNMRKFAHCVVLTRVGNFYELYFEHAEQYAPLLNLKSGRKKTNAGIVPMAGFPHFQLDRFLKMLVQDLGKHVAISEEFANDAEGKVKSGGLLFDRRVTRVISPGTLIDEKFVDPWESNFLLCIHHEEVGAIDTASKEEVMPPEGTKLGLAWVDLSSGDFSTQDIDLDSLPSILARIGPREVVVDQALQDTPGSPTLNVLQKERQTVTFHRGIKNNLDSEWLETLSRLGMNVEVSQFSHGERAASVLLLSYVEAQLQGGNARLQSPVHHQAAESMLIDKNSIKALEIKSTLADNLYEGSLLHTIRKTVTKSGTRLLSQRLSAPSTSLEEINSRLDMVTELKNHPELHERLVDSLRQSYDSFRLVQKFSFGRGDADDLMSLARTVEVTAEVNRILQDHIDMGDERDSGSERAEVPSRPFQNLLAKLSLEEPRILSKRIVTCIDEEMLSEQHRLEDVEAADLVNLADEILTEAGEEGLKGVPRSVRAKLSSTIEPSPPTWGENDVWIMRQQASPTLKRLHESLATLFTEKEGLETSLREKSEAKTLTLKWNPGKGYICHVRGKDSKSRVFDKLNATRQISSSQSTRTFYLAEWSHLGSRVDEARARIRAEEQRVFASLREAVIRNLVTLRRNAAVLDELDVACAFATVARDRHWVRPIVNNSTKHEIVGGRHPMVEAGLTINGRNFTSNDCNVGSQSPFIPSSTVSSATTETNKTSINHHHDSTSPSPPQTEERILLITGPNMAGKSTYLRQNALISILAQSGSYVPASYASLGIVDKLFSRVGSADNLYLSQSTFMLEMLETSHILRNATSRSFVVMDEVGRGTTPEDGLAVSFACLWFLYWKVGCRGLFATHFHGLVDLVDEWEGVGCWCTDVVEDDDEEEDEEEELSGDGNGGDGGKKGWAYVHRLRRGVNRRSHALKVARMAGLPREAIEVAGRVLRELQMERKGGDRPPEGKKGNYLRSAG